MYERVYSRDISSELTLQWDNARHYNPRQCDQPEIETIVGNGSYQIPPLKAMTQLNGESVTERVMEEGRALTTKSLD